MAPEASIIGASPFPRSAMSADTLETYAHRTPGDIAGQGRSSLTRLLQQPRACFYWLKCSVLQEHGPQQESSGTHVSRRECVRGRGADRAIPLRRLPSPAFYSSVPIAGSFQRTPLVMSRSGSGRTIPPSPCANPPCLVRVSPMERRPERLWGCLSSSK